MGQRDRRANDLHRLRGGRVRCCTRPVGAERVAFPSPFDAGFSSVAKSNRMLALPASFKPVFPIEKDGFAVPTNRCLAELLLLCGLVGQATPTELSDSTHSQHHLTLGFALAHVDRDEQRRDHEAIRCFGTIDAPCVGGTASSRRHGGSCIARKS